MTKWKSLLYLFPLFNDHISFCIYQFAKPRNTLEYDYIIHPDYTFYLYQEYSFSKRRNHKHCFSISYPLEHMVKGKIQLEIILSRQGEFFQYDRLCLSPKNIGHVDACMNQPQYILCFNHTCTKCRICHRNELSVWEDRRWGMFENCMNDFANLFLISKWMGVSSHFLKKKLLENNMNTIKSNMNNIKNNMNQENDTLNNIKNSASPSVPRPVLIAPINRESHSTYYPPIQKINAMKSSTPLERPKKWCCIC